MRKKFLKIIITCILGSTLFVGCSSNNVKQDDNEKVNEIKKEEKVSNNKKNEVKNEVKNEGTKITYENFLNVAMNQSYEDVKAVLGEGTEMTSSEIGGINTKMYAWTGEGIANMNITIQDGVVIGKAQTGLNKNYANITLEKYNSVSEGMNFEEVKGILGSGELTSQTEIAGLGCSIYSWVNEDGSNCNVTFQDGIVNIKAQFGLN